MLTKNAIYAHIVIFILLLPVCVIANDVDSEICNVSIDGVSPDNNLAEAEDTWSTRSYSLHDKSLRGIPRVKGGGVSDSPFTGEVDQGLHFIVPEFINRGFISWTKVLLRERDPTSANSNANIVQRITVSKSGKIEAPASGLWKDAVFADRVQTQIDYWCPIGAPRADYVACDIDDRSTRITVSKTFATGNISKCEYSIGISRFARGGLSFSEHNYKTLRNP